MDRWFDSVCTTTKKGAAQDVRIEHRQNIRSLKMSRTYPRALYNEDDDASDDDDANAEICPCEGLPWLGTLIFPSASRRKLITV